MSIKVEIYNSYYSWEEEEPDEVLSLKEFEEKFNDRFNDNLEFDPRYVKFVLD